MKKGGKKKDMSNRTVLCALIVIIIVSVISLAIYIESLQAETRSGEQTIQVAVLSEPAEQTSSTSGQATLSIIIPPQLNNSK